MSGGKRHWESSESVKKQEAIKFLNDRLGDSGKGLVVSPKVGKIKVRDGLQSVIDNMTANRKRSIMHTQRRIDKHILQTVGTEIGYFHPDRRLNTIGTDDLDAYTAHRLAQGASQASCNLELAIIRRAFKLALRSKSLANMPHIPMLTLKNVREGFFEKHEFEAVRAALPGYLRGVVTFAYFTGWRTGE